jgi:outer membrane protein
MKKLLLTCTIVVVAFSLSHCVSRQAIEQDLTHARLSAYKEWTRQKEQKSDSESVIHGKLSLRKALELALAHNRTLQVVQEEKNIARGRTLESYGEVLPNVMLNGNYTRLNADGTDYNGSYVQVTQRNQYEGSVSVTQPLYKGGLGQAALRASQYYDALTDENIRNAYQGTIYSAAKAYYEVLLVREQLNVTKTYATLADAHLKDVKIKRRFGTASDFNVLRSQVELSNARAEMIAFQNRLKLANTGLLNIIGLSQESRIELTERLDYTPLTVREEAEVRTAFLNRPDLAAAELTVKLQEEAVTKAYSKYYPTVSAFYNHSLEKPDPYYEKNNEWDDAWSAGIIVNLPIFDGLKREGKVAQERSALKQRNIGLIDARENVILEIKNAVLSLRDATELVDVQRLTLTQAEEGLRLAEVGYREGTLDQVSVLDARAALTQAQLVYYRSLYEHTIARLNLRKAEGLLALEEEKS